MQEALSGLEKIAVKGDEIKQALLQGRLASLRRMICAKRFDTFMNERCRRRDATKAALRDRVTNG